MHVRVSKGLRKTSLVSDGRVCKETCGKELRKEKFGED